MERTVLAEVETALARVARLPPETVEWTRAILKFRGQRPALGLRLILARDPSRADAIEDRILYFAYMNPMYHTMRDSLLFAAYPLLPTLSLSEPARRDAEREFMRWRADGREEYPFHETDRWWVLEESKPSRDLILQSSAQRLIHEVSRCPIFAIEFLVLFAVADPLISVVCQSFELIDIMASMHVDAKGDMMLRALCRLANHGDDATLLAEDIYRRWGLEGRPGTSELIGDHLYTLGGCYLYLLIRSREQAIAFLGLARTAPHSPVGTLVRPDGDRAIMTRVIQFLIPRSYNPTG